MKTLETFKIKKNSLISKVNTIDVFSVGRTQVFFTNKVKGTYKE